MGASNHGEEIALPGIISAIWGRDQQQRPGPKPGLDLPTIAAAAVKIADEEGLRAVSMSRVAAELGFSTMALYRYVSSKNDLIILMYDVAAGTVDSHSEEGDSWRTRLERWSFAQRDVFRRHPWVAEVPISGPPVTPNQLAWMDAALAAMTDTPLRPEEKMSVLLLISNFIRSTAQLELQLAAGLQEADPANRAVIHDYGRVVVELIDPAAMPALYATLATGAVRTDDDVDDEFVFGLRTLLDGVAVLVAGRSKEQRSR